MFCVQWVTRVSLMFLAFHVAHSAVVPTGGASYDEPCSSDTDCIEANTRCMPDTISTCPLGKCDCLEYMEWDSGDSKCKVKKYNKDRCNSTLTSCQGGTGCSSSVDGQCACPSGQYYNSVLESCISNSPRLEAIGGDCSDATDCYSTVTGSVKCVVPAGSSTSQKKCQCETGYLTQGGACRKPVIGEACTGSVGCSMSLSVSDGSIVTEECSSTTNMCVCPTGSRVLTFDVEGLTYSLCMSDYTGTKLANGATCTASNECTSNLCTQCPGETSYSCIQTP